MKPLEVPHVEIRKTEHRTTADVDVADGPEAVLPILRELLTGREQESFVMLIIGARGRITGYREVARGLPDRVEVPVRNLFRTALACDARMLVIAHNHPSGNPEPSMPDNMMTARLEQAGLLIDCPIFDHIIIGDNDRYHSYREARGGSAGLDTSQPRQPPELD